MFPRNDDISNEFCIFNKFFKEYFLFSDAVIFVEWRHSWIPPVRGPVYNINFKTKYLNAHDLSQVYNRSDRYTAIINYTSTAYHFDHYHNIVTDIPVVGISP